MTRTQARPRKPGDRNLPQVAEDLALLPTPQARDCKGQTQQGAIRTDTGSPATEAHMALPEVVQKLSG